MLELGEIEASVDVGNNDTHGEFIDVNDSVIRQVNQENFMNRVAHPWKQVYLPSSMNNMINEKTSLARSTTPDIMTPFDLLDKKNTEDMKPMNEATGVPKLQNKFQKSDLMNSSLSLSVKSAGSKKTMEVPLKNKFSKFRELTKKVNDAKVKVKLQIHQPDGETNEPNAKVLKVEDDPYVFEVKARREKDTETAAREEFSLLECLQESSSDEELEEARDNTPSIDELLKLPERPENGGKTKDEILDILDIEIAERKKKHEEEMAKLDTEITAEKQRQEERRERMKQNAVLRDRLEVEINELVLRRMFKENIEYLKNIETGMINSWRHQEFHKSGRARHALFYSMISDPYTDDQLQWTLEEMGEVWMKTKREQMDRNEYVWKVLLPECFVKFYMDHFGMDKIEAEQRISETPLRKGVEDSNNDNSSDDDL